VNSGRTLLGVGTGNFPEDMSLKERVEAVSEMGAEGIEINLGMGPGIGVMEEHEVRGLRKTLEDFEFVTIHAPQREDMDSESYRKLLGDVEQIRKKLGADSVVIHPDWILDSHEFLAEFERPAVENMSFSKGFGRREFREFMAETDAEVVLDVCHSFTWHRNDLVEMYMEFGDRISHIHLSGLGDDEHEPLFRNPEILNEEVRAVVVNNRVVLESAVESVEEMEEELDFVRDWLVN